MRGWAATTPSVPFLLTSSLKNIYTCPERTTSTIEEEGMWFEGGRWLEGKRLLKGAFKSGELGVGALETGARYSKSYTSYLV